MPFASRHLYTASVAMPRPTKAAPKPNKPVGTARNAETTATAYPTHSNVHDHIAYYATEQQMRWRNLIRPLLYRYHICHYTLSSYNLLFAWPTNRKQLAPSP